MTQNKSMPDESGVRIAFFFNQKKVEEGFSLFPDKLWWCVGTADEIEATLSKLDKELGENETVYEADSNYIYALAEQNNTLKHQIELAEAELRKRKNQNG